MMPLFVISLKNLIFDTSFWSFQDYFGVTSCCNIQKKTATSE